MSEHNVVAVAFTEPSEAYQAVTELKGARFEGFIELHAATIVTRDEAGRLGVPEADGAGGSTPGWSGSLIGLLIRVLGGPIGMRFGWTADVLGRGALRLRGDQRPYEVLTDISTLIPTMGTAVVAEVTEYAAEVIDDLMASLGGYVYRRSAGSVLAELEASEEAYERARVESDRARDRRNTERPDAEEREAALKTSPASPSAAQTYPPT